MFLEAAHDVLAIVRAMWLAADSPTKRRRLAEAGRELKLAIGVASESEPASLEYKRAMSAIDRALNEACDTMHFVEPLAPVLGAAVGRMKRVR